VWRENFQDHSYLPGENESGPGGIWTGFSLENQAKNSEKTGFRNVDSFSHFEERILFFLVLLNIFFHFVQK
jgi:hypothetical protein